MLDMIIICLHLCVLGWLTCLGVVLRCSHTFDTVYYLINSMSIVYSGLENWTFPHMLHASVSECCKWEYLSVHIIFSSRSSGYKWWIFNSSILMNALLGVMNSCLILTISLVTLNHPKSPDTCQSNQWTLLVARLQSIHLPSKSFSVPLQLGYTDRHRSRFSLSFWTSDKCKNRNVKKWKMSVSWYADTNRGLILNSVRCWRWHSVGEAEHLEAG